MPCLNYYTVIKAYCIIHRIKENIISGHWSGLKVFDWVRSQDLKEDIEMNLATDQISGIIICPRQAAVSCSEDKSLLLNQIEILIEYHNI